MEPRDEPGTSEAGIGPFFEFGSRCSRSICGAGSERIVAPDGARKISRVPNDYFAPGAADAVYREVAGLLQFKWAARTMGEYFARLDTSRRIAEAGIQMGGALRMQKTPPSQSDKSLALASA